MKICSKCKKNENETRFYSSSCRTGLCKYCFDQCVKFQRENNPRSYAKYIFRGIKRRVLSDPSYSKIKIEIDEADWIEFVFRNWSTIQSIKKSGETPSIDRIDPKKNYCLENLRFIPKSLNSKLGGETYSDKFSKAVLAYSDDMSTKFKFKSKQQAGRWGFASTSIFNAIKLGRKYKDLNWRYV